MTEPTERTLIEAALRGDADSFGRLCAGYYNALAATAYSVLGDHHLAEDAAQEAMIRAFQGLGGLKDSRRFGSWLAQICRNTARDFRQKHCRRIDPDRLRSSDSNPGETAESELIRQAIRELPETDRELITLRYYNRQSHEQMAKLLGLSRAAVNNRLGRAKRKMAKYLRDHGYAESDL